MAVQACRAKKTDLRVTEAVGWRRASAPRPSAEPIAGARIRLPYRLREFKKATHEG